MSMNYWSSEIPSYSNVKSLSFALFHSLVLVCSYPWNLACSYILMYTYFNIHDHPCFLMIHERSSYFAHTW
jgi:hypothetical protein